MIRRDVLPTPNLTGLSLPNVQNLDLVMQSPRQKELYEALRCITSQHGHDDKSFLEGVKGRIDKGADVRPATCIGDRGESLVRQRENQNLTLDTLDRIDGVIGSYEERDRYLEAEEAKQREKERMRQLAEDWGGFSSSKELVADLEDRVAHREKVRQELLRPLHEPPPILAGESGPYSVTAESYDSQYSSLDAVTVAMDNLLMEAEEEMEHQKAFLDHMDSLFAILEERVEEAEEADSDDNGDSTYGNGFDKRPNTPGTDDMGGNNSPKAKGVAKLPALLDRRRESQADFRSWLVDSARACDVDAMSVVSVVSDAPRSSALSPKPITRAKSTTPAGANTARSDKSGVARAASAGAGGRKRSNKIGRRRGSTAAPTGPVVSADKFAEMEARCRALEEEIEAIRQLNFELCIESKKAKKICVPKYIKDRYRDRLEEDEARGGIGLKGSITDLNQMMTLVKIVEPNDYHGGEEFQIFIAPVTKDLTKLRLTLEHLQKDQSVHMSQLQHRISDIVTDLDFLEITESLNEHFPALASAFVGISNEGQHRVVGDDVMENLRSLDLPRPPTRDELMKIYVALTNNDRDKELSFGDFLEAIMRLVDVIRDPKVPFVESVEGVMASFGPSVASDKQP